MAKRLYDLSYQNTNEPIYVEHAGNLLKISGLVMQGMGSTHVLLLPSAYKPSLPASAFIQPTLDEWAELLRRSDDPVFFEDNDIEKPMHRKVQRAISGSVQQKIFARDKFRCMSCGRKMGDVQLTVDHWIPLELSGRDDSTNYISMCRAENKDKGSEHPKSWCERKGLNYDMITAYLQKKSI